jgi:hypothetical protein
MAKLTDAELRKIIREELSDLDEGLLDQLIGKTKGTFSKYKGIGQNLGQLARGAAKGGRVDFAKDPKVMKAVTMAAGRVKTFDKELNAVMTDFAKDMIEFFGEDIGDAPEVIKDPLTQIGTRFVDIRRHLGALSKDLKSGKLSQSGTIAKPEDEEEKSSTPNSKPGFYSSENN